MIFAGKFHPSDTSGREAFNNILAYAKNTDAVAILPNYELKLSKLLKRGSDIWLNTPLRPLEASGTSGMSANLNGSIHVSTYDGWAVEGTFHGINGFIINEESQHQTLSVEETSHQDYESMMGILEQQLIPTYYDNKPAWAHLMQNAIKTAEAYFNSDRMVVEYFNRLYKPAQL